MNEAPQQALSMSFWVLVEATAWPDQVRFCGRRQTWRTAHYHKLQRMGHFDDTNLQYVLGCCPCQFLHRSIDMKMYVISLMISVTFAIATPVLANSLTDYIETQTAEQREQETRDFVESTMDRYSESAEDRYSR